MDCRLNDYVGRTAVMKETIDRMDFVGKEFKRLPCLHGGQRVTVVYTYDQWFARPENCVWVDGVKRSPDRFSMVQSSDFQFDN